jgi:hypothetical protein
VRVNPTTGKVLQEESMEEALFVTGDRAANGAHTHHLLPVLMAAVLVLDVLMVDVMLAMVMLAVLMVAVLIVGCARA